jgi:hypothetical protein
MEPRMDVNPPGVREPSRAAGSPCGMCGNTLCVGDIMSRDVLTAAPDDPISSIAQKMSERSVSCVVVLYRERVLGIFTEKDLLDTVAGGDTNLYRRGVSERMSSPVDTVAAEVSILEAIRDMQRVRDFLGGVPHPPDEVGLSTSPAPPTLEQMVSCAAPASEAS